MPDEFDDVADAPADGAEASDVQSEETEIQSGEPGYVQGRIARVKRQRDEERRRADQLEGELRAIRTQISSQEARLNAQLEKPKTVEDDHETQINKAVSFLDKVDSLNQILLTSDDSEQVSAAKQQLRNLKPGDIEYARREVARLQAVRVGADVEKNINTRLDGKSRQDEFSRKVTAEFGPDAVNATSPLFAEASKQYAQLLNRFGNDDNGAVTWMALEAARKKVNPRDGRGTDLDRRRLAIEGQVRRDGADANKIAALNAKGDPESRMAAFNMTFDQFYKQNYGV